MGNPVFLYGREIRLDNAYLRASLNAYLTSALSMNNARLGFLTRQDFFTEKIQLLWIRVRDTNDQRA